MRHGYLVSQEYNFFKEFLLSLQFYGYFAVSDREPRPGILVMLLVGKAICLKISLLKYVSALVDLFG